MSRSPITAIRRALQWIQPIPNPVETPVPVRRAPQPAPQVDFRLSPLVQRRSASKSMGRRNAKLPKVALHPPAGRAVIHPLIKLQPRHSLGSQVWSQWNERNKALGPAWTGSLDRRTTPQLEARRLTLRSAVRAQLKAIKANKAVPGASTFDQAEMIQELRQRLKEAKGIKGLLDQRKAPTAPLGAEVWDSARIARKPLETTKPLHLPQMPNDELQKRRDALELALKAHGMSSQMFVKTHGQREFGHEILDRSMTGYRTEIGEIEKLLAQRTPRR